MPRLLWITTFGLGYMRPASGTWGSLPPVVVALALWLSGLGPERAPLVFHAALGVIFVVFSAACILQGREAEKRWGKDPSNAVADETAGQCLALVALPAAAFASPTAALLTLGVAFVTFRVMDIIKPWPAHQLQRLPHGWGILVDDLFAGMYALAVVQAFLRLALSRLGF